MPFGGVALVLATWCAGERSRWTSAIRAYGRHRSVSGTSSCAAVASGQAQRLRRIAARRSQPDVL